MTFKPLNENDIVNTRTLLHEAIPLTGTIVSGTYSDENVKQYSHGMFVSVYDYPYLSSSANHIFDVTVGISPSSNYYNLIKLIDLLLSFLQIGNPKILSLLVHAFALQKLQLVYRTKP